MKHLPQVEVYKCRIRNSPPSAFTLLSHRFHFVLDTRQVGSPCARGPLSLPFHFAFTSTRAERRYDSARCERPNAIVVRAYSAASLERYVEHVLRSAQHVGVRTYEVGGRSTEESIVFRRLGMVGAELVVVYIKQHSSSGTMSI